MRKCSERLVRSNDGAVAPTVALSLFALIAAGGIAFDYARLASVDTELQNAADQAALAAATQLDGTSNSRARAEAAARQLVSNLGLMANDNANRNLAVGWVAFCSAYNDDLPPNPSDTQTSVTGCTLATGDADAKIVVVQMATREAVYALTPIAAAYRSGALTAQAAAHVGSAICKTPPVMICNPDEPVGNTNEMLDFNPARGTGLRLVTGSATVPGNFGWLEAGLGNGTQALAGELGYNVPLGPCQPTSGVTTKTGMDTAVLNAFNTRFDVYANGNTTCPNQGGGTCSPAVNTRKDLACEPNNAGTGCKNDTWEVPTSVYDPFWDDDADTSTPNQLAALPATPAGSDGRGPLDPLTMGYPHDLCHSSWRSRHTCDIKGSAIWDVNAYFRVNYGIDEAGWRSWMNMVGTTAIPARYDVYKKEIADPDGPSGTHGIQFSQVASTASKPPYTFSIPATGRAGVAESASAPFSQPDRRVIAAAVLNCRALDVKGKTVNVPVPAWLKVFLVEPAFTRPAPASQEYTNQKDIYVEFIEKTVAKSDAFNTVVRRDVPYLLK